MASPVVLCADIGTSSLKAALIDREGRLRFSARIAYPSPPPGGEGLPASAWEEALARALGMLAREAPEFRPAGVCVSGNGPTLVPVSAGGEALRPLHWYDGRGIPADAPGLGGGGSQDPGQRSLFLPRAAWLREREPGLYERAKYLLSSQEWLSWRLGADPVTVLPWDAYRPYYWDEGGCRFFKVDGDKFPPFVKLGTLIGRVSPGAARNLGEAGGFLPPGTPIVAGGPDFIAALTGAGVLEPGLAMDRAGTSEGINLCAAALPAARPRGFRFLPGAVEGLWNIGVVIPRSGGLFEWYRNRTGQTARAHDGILAEIAALPPRGEAPFFLPGPQGGGRYLGAENPGAVELGRAVSEAMGFLSAEAMDRIGELARLEDRDFSLGELRLSGGQCKSRHWNRLKADITGRCLLAPEIPDGELAGDAAAAFFALGDYGSIKEAAGGIIRMGDRYEPDPRRASLYAERRARFRELRARAGEPEGAAREP